MSGGYNTGRPYHRSRQGPAGQHKDATSNGFGSILHYDNYQFLNGATGSTAPVSMEITSWSNATAGVATMYAGWVAGGKYQNQITGVGGKRQNPAGNFQFNIYHDVNEGTTFAGKITTLNGPRHGSSYATAVEGATTYQYQIQGFDKDGNREASIYRQAMNAPLSDWLLVTTSVPTVGVYGMATWDKGSYIYFTNGYEAAYTDRIFYRLTISDGTITTMAKPPAAAACCYGYIAWDDTDDVLYMAGGFNGAIKDTVHKFDPSTGATGSWTNTGDTMPSGMWAGCYDEYDGGLLVFAGNDAAGKSGGCHWYDFSTNTWETWAVNAQERALGIGFTLKAADIGSGTLSFTKDTFFSMYGLYGAASESEIDTIDYGVND